jgi:glycosyltransferase involved in cell wall biosynthesis
MMKNYLQRIERLVDGVEDWSRLPDEPLVSVWMITFNHEKFIREALDSVLMQETNFPYEIVIGEDKSSDRTREIVCEYQRRHSNKIRLRLSRKNLYSQKLKPGLGVLNACRGKYIAMLEGDDYWTDPLKLQKQVDLLDAHQEYVGCFCVGRQFEDGKAEVQVFHIPQCKSAFDIDFLRLLNGNPCLTASVVFRKATLKMPSWFVKLPFGDLGLYLLLAYPDGKFRCLPDVMAAYRIHAGSSHGSVHCLGEWKRYVQIYRQHIVFWRIIRKRFKLNQFQKQTINTTLEKCIENIFGIAIANQGWSIMVWCVWVSFCEWEVRSSLLFGKKMLVSWAPVMSGVVMKRFTRFFNNES